MKVFLNTHTIDYKLQSTDAKLERASIAKEAEGYTVHETCSNQFFKQSRCTVDILLATPERSREVLYLGAGYSVGCGIWQQQKKDLDFILSP